VNVGGKANVALAEALATWAHTGQVDKNGYDYIDHPKAVFYRVFADDAEDYDGQITAWLHDTLEDTSLRAEYLKPFFPPYIVEAVVAMSFRYYSADETREQYYARVRVNPIAKRVKLHDIAHNTSPKRMDKLEAETRDRLKIKYAKALNHLVG
jgi:(p)ppGpp synthase/HD superfamily hydrolase